MYIADKSIDYFRNKLAELHETKKILTDSVMGGKENVVLASYQVSLLIAKHGQPHTIGEKIVLPAAKLMVNTVLGEKYSKQLGAISLSDNTVKRRIEEMATNVRDTLLERVKTGECYALQLDESTDISTNANLLTFIRYEFENTIHEDLLFCSILPTHANAESIFAVLNTFMTENGLNWEQCVGLTTDGARALSGKYKGLIARVKTVAPRVTWTHCCIHREALATRNMPPELDDVMKEAVRVINFIKARPLNSRLFSVLCKEMGSDHEHLLLHSEVRWLSRGKILTRLFELRDEVRLFLLDGKCNFKDFFNDFSWLARLAYLADIFSHLNELNSSLQGTQVTLFTVQDKIDGTIKKMSIWARRIRKTEFDSFPTLHDFLSANEETLPDSVSDVMVKHLELLGSTLRQYFPPLVEKMSWIRNPFLETEHELPSLEEDQLAEVSCDSSLKTLYHNSTSLIDFWIHARPLYPAISRKAILRLMPFTTTYLCECTFSALTQIKTKYRNRANVECDLRLRVTTLEPDLKRLVSGKQHHPSH